MKRGALLANTDFDQLPVDADLVANRGGTEIAGQSIKLAVITAQSGTFNAFVGQDAVYAKDAVARHRAGLATGRAKYDRQGGRRSANED